MKIKVQHLMDSVTTLTAIINRAAIMPQRGKYLIARMHTKLLPEFKTIDARRDEMIKAYDNPQMRRVPGAVVEADQPWPMERVPNKWQVPEEKMPEFIAAWKEIANEEIEVDVQPLPLAALSLPNGSDGSIEASELIVLGDLVFDNAA